MDLLLYFLLDLFFCQKPHSSSPFSVFFSVVLKIKTLIIFRTSNWIQKNNLSDLELQHHLPWLSELLLQQPKPADSSVQATSVVAVTSSNSSRLLIRRKITKPKLSPPQISAVVSFQSVTIFFPYGHVSPLLRHRLLLEPPSFAPDSGEEKDRSTPSQSSPPPRLKPPWSSYSHNQSSKPLWEHHLSLLLSLLLLCDRRRITPELIHGQSLFSRNHWTWFIRLFSYGDLVP